MKFAHVVFFLYLCAILSREDINSDYNKKHECVIERMNVNVPQKIKAMSKQNKILISVIIPSYNRAYTVGETIESIMAQEGLGTEFDMEIVVGDDCSTDNARVVLEQYRQKYPDYIRLFLREQNVGLGANWAMCVKDCQGKYICNCDNDDYWHNTKKLLLQLEYMESHPDCNVLLTNHRTHNRSTGEIIEKKAVIEGQTLQDALFGLGKLDICNATIMYRAEYLKSHVDLDEYIRRRFFLQDWNTWVILAATTQFDILPISTATFGIETTSITRPKTYEQLQKRMDRDADCARYLGELLPKYKFDEEDWKKNVNTHMLHLAYQRNDYRKAHQLVSDGTYNNVSSKMARCWLTFKCYRIYKILKSSEK